MPSQGGTLTPPGLAAQRFLGLSAHAPRLRDRLSQKGHIASERPKSSFRARVRLERRMTPDVSLQVLLAGQISLLHPFGRPCEIQRAAAAGRGGSQHMHLDAGRNMIEVVL